MPILTVVMVCFDAGATIARSVRSLVTDKPVDVEFVVIDGASRDDTVVQLQAFRDRIDLLVSEPDSGIYDAMNKGLARASGEFVAFLNADDVYVPGALRSMVEALASTPESTDVLFGDWVGVTPAGTKRTRSAELGLGWKYRLCHQAMAARRRLFDSGFDTRYRLCADFDLILRWQTEGVKFVHLPRPLVEFSEAGASNRQVETAVRESMEIARRRWGVIRAAPFLLSLWLYRTRCRLTNRPDR